METKITELKGKCLKRVFEILEKNKRCCVNCHHCVPCGIEGKSTYVVRCDVVERMYGFKGTKSISSLIRKYKTGKYPFACRCFHYDGGP